jgi:hypothetical protein
MSQAKVIPMKTTMAPTAPTARAPVKSTAALPDADPVRAPARVYIYGLVDPRDGLIHYVGRTTAALRTRLHAHMSLVAGDGKNLRGYGLDKLKWLADLKAARMTPSIKPLEEVESEHAHDAERRWVQALFRAGVPLTNKQYRPPSKLDAPEWVCGFASALVEVYRLRGEAATIRGALEATGLTIDKIRRAGVEDLDLREIIKAVCR